MAPFLIDRLHRMPLWTVGDKGFDSDAFRRKVADMGSSPAIPRRRNSKLAGTCPDWVYRNRHLVENMWARFKEWRGIATRYDKTIEAYASAVFIFAALDWIE